MGKKGVLGLIAYILVLIGALNWGLVGVFNWNLVKWLLGVGVLAKIVYILVGLAAVYKIVLWCGCCKGKAKKGKRRR